MSRRRPTKSKSRKRRSKSKSKSRKDTFTYLRSQVKKKGVPTTYLNKDELKSFLSKEKFSLGWRWRYIFPHLKSKKEARNVIDMLISPVRNLNKLRNKREQKLVSNFLNNNKVKLSLTTSPTRLPKITAVLATLDLSNVHSINIVLPERYGKNKEKYKKIPEQILNFPKTKIIRIKTDLGPITKILPTITRSRNKKDIVISIDDDIAYPLGFINELIYQKITKHKNAAITMGTSMNFYGDINGMKKSWPQKKQRRPFVDLVEGWSSVLYSKNIVNAPCMKKISKLSTECRLSDDFVISYVLSLSKVKKVIINNRFAFDPYPYDYGGEGDALHAGRDLDGKPKKFVKHDDTINFIKYEKCLQAIQEYVKEIKKGKKKAGPCFKRKTSKRR